MALVPRPLTDIVLYAAGLSGREQREIETRVRESELQQKLHARHYENRMADAEDLVEHIADGDRRLAAKTRAIITEDNDEMLADDLLDLRRDWKAVSRRILYEGYGNGR